MRLSVHHIVSEESSSQVQCQSQHSCVVESDLTDDMFSSEQMMQLKRKYKREMKLQLCLTAELTFVLALYNAIQRI